CCSPSEPSSTRRPRARPLPRPQLRKTRRRDDVNFSPGAARRSADGRHGVVARRHGEGGPVADTGRYRVSRGLRARKRRRPRGSRAVSGPAGHRQGRERQRLRLRTRAARQRQGRVLPAGPCARLPLRATRPAALPVQGRRQPREHIAHARSGSTSRHLTTRGETVKPKWLLTLVLGLVGVAVYGGIALATPPSGVTNPPWSPVVGTFAGGIDAKAQPATNAGNAAAPWQIRITAKGWTDVHILENVIAPGGTFGWHSHPGPSLVIVKSGTLSVYH